MPRLTRLLTLLWTVTSDMVSPPPLLSTLRPFFSWKAWLRECRVGGAGAWYLGSTRLVMFTASVGSGVDRGLAEDTEPEPVTLDLEYVPLGWMDTAITLSSFCLHESGRLNLRFF